MSERHPESWVLEWAGALAHKSEGHRIKVENGSCIGLAGSASTPGWLAPEETTRCSRSEIPRATSPTKQGTYAGKEPSMSSQEVSS